MRPGRPVGANRIKDHRQRLDHLLQPKAGGGLAVREARYGKITNLTAEMTALVEGNDIRPNGSGTDTRISSIFVVSDRNWDRHYLRNVRIVNNTTAGSGISIIGAPARNNVVSGNRHVGDRPRVIINGANARVEKNTGYTVQVPEIKKPLADPNRPSATAPAAGK
ncbi:MAG: hypothetical protein ABSF26_02080 [Thermoguttaceae bacterium]|jgi:hypothetical protein